MDCECFSKIMSMVEKMQKDGIVNTDFTIKCKKCGQIHYVGSKITNINKKCKKINLTI